MPSYHSSSHNNGKRSRGGRSRSRSRDGGSRTKRGGERGGEREREREYERGERTREQRGSSTRGGSYHGSSTRSATSGSGTGTTLEISNVAQEVTVEEVFDFFMPRAMRIEGVKRTSEGVFLLKLYDREALQDCERLDGEYFRGRRMRVEGVSDQPAQQTLPHPFRPDAGKKSAAAVTLFVGNIPETVQDSDVRKFFERIHVTPVSVTMRRGGGGRSTAHFAHVRFGTSDDCIKGSTLAGAFLKGARLRIDWAAEKTPQVASAAAAAGREAGTGTEEFRGKTNRVFVGNLSEDMADGEILPPFQNFGRIASFRNFKDKHGARYAYVTFEDVKAAEAAVDELRHANLNIRGQSIRVDFARQDRVAPPALDPSDSAPTTTGKRPRSPSPVARPPAKIAFNVPAEYQEPSWEVFYPVHALPSHVHGLGVQQL